MRRSGSWSSILKAAGLLSALVCAAGVEARAQSVEPTYAFGVLNQQSPIRTAERWNPILLYVAQATGARFSLKMGSNVQQTNEMMAQGAFDFVFTNHNFKPEYDPLGLKVIAKWGDQPSQTVIAVPNDSAHKRIEDLADRAVAFPSAQAFLGYAVPSVALKQAGIAVQQIFAGNQEGVLAQLKAGRVEAGAVNSRYLTDYSAREGVSFRTLYESQPFPDLAVAVHPRVPAALAAKVQAALVGMTSDPQGQRILEACGCPGFAMANDDDYLTVREVYRQAAK